MDHSRLLLLPFAGLFIGWLTNYLAIKMLFHPKKPVNLGLFTLQGVFQKVDCPVPVKIIIGCPF